MVEDTFSSVLFFEKNVINVKPVLILEFLDADFRDLSILLRILNNWYKMVPSLQNNHLATYSTKSLENMGLPDQDAKSPDPDLERKRVWIRILGVKESESGSRA